MLTDGMTRAERRRRATAIHEAGHAVAAIALGRRFKYVTLEPKGDSLGHVRVTPPRYQTGLESHFDYLIRALAGVEAERAFGFRPQRYGWESDRQAAVDHALSIAGGGEEATLWVRLAGIRARRLVEVWRRSIEALADRLLTEPRLSFEAARETALAARRQRPC